MSAEITHVDKWYQPWRDTIRLHYSDWQRRVEGGEQPPPYFFRMPGAEHAPTVGWQVSLDSNILGVFEPSLVFAIGNTYHEWEDIGDRLARYHSATEQLIYPLLGNDLIGVAEYGVDTHRHWSDKLVQLQVPAAYATRGNLHREYAANLSLMEDVLTQLDSRFADAGRLKARLDSTIASLRPR
jgi:hypothetical protein